MWTLSHTVEVEGLTSNYYVTQERAERLLDSGRATQVSKSYIRIVGRKRRKNTEDKALVKRHSGPVPVIQLVLVSTIRPRNKPKYLD